MCSGRRVPPISCLAVRTRDEDLVAQGEGFISDSVSMIDDEDVFGWLFRMIWGKELQLRQQIADADVENLDATFDFLTSACRLAAHILLGWGEGDASSAYIARLFLIEQYDEALNCILPYSNVSLNANETELVVFGFARSRHSRGDAAWRDRRDGDEAA